MSNHIEGRVNGLSSRSIIRLALASAVAQIRMAWRSFDDITFVLTVPLQTLISAAIFLSRGRGDLIEYSVVASTLLTIGQVSFYVSSELIATERTRQIFELAVATPAPYWVIILSRALAMALLGILGFVFSVAIVVFGFHVPIVILHPYLFLLSFLSTAVAAAGTALITSALFSLGKNARSINIAVTGPIYLLGGILVPVQYLPRAAQVLSPAIYLYWSANLFRDCMKNPHVSGVGERMAILLFIGGISILIGRKIVNRLIDRLRLSGKIGLA